MQTKALIDGVYNLVGRQAELLRQVLVDLDLIDQVLEHLHFLVGIRAALAIRLVSLRRPVRFPHRLYRLLESGL